MKTLTLALTGTALATFAFAAPPDNEATLSQTCQTAGFVVDGNKTSGLCTNEQAPPYHAADQQQYVATEPLKHPGISDANTDATEKKATTHCAMTMEVTPTGCSSSVTGLQPAAIVNTRTSDQVFSGGNDANDANFDGNNAFTEVTANSTSRSSPEVAGTCTAATIETATTCNGLNLTNATLTGVNGINNERNGHFANKKKCDGLSDNDGNANALATNLDGTFDMSLYKDGGHANSATTNDGCKKKKANAKKATCTATRSTG